MDRLAALGLLSKASNLSLGISTTGISNAHHSSTQPDQDSKALSAQLQSIMGPSTMLGYSNGGSQLASSSQESELGS